MVNTGVKTKMRPKCAHAQVPVAQCGPSALNDRGQDFTELGAPMHRGHEFNEDPVRPRTVTGFSMRPSALIYRGDEFNEA